MAWSHRLWSALRPGRLQNDIARELSFHLEERADQLRAEGLSAEEARRQARRRFGNLALEVERTRDMDIAGWLDRSLRNVRYSVRTLVRTPGFTLTVIVTLALSIGANSALFSTLNAVLLRPLAFPDADRLVELSQTDRKSTETLVAPIRLEDWNQLNSTFEAMTGYNTEDVSETSGNLPETVRSAFVAPRFFDVWGIAPALGRWFSPSDHREGAAPVVVVSDRYWRNQLAADPNVLTRTIHIDGLSYSIIGVMPASFRFPDRDVEIWRARIYNRFTQFRRSTWYIGIGRMKPGISLAKARADLDVVQRQLAVRYPDTDATIGVRIEPFKETVVGEVRGSLWLLFGAVSLLLLIACTNIAALLLSRGVQREREIAVCVSLGASRFAVAAQIVTETAILALAGALAGLCVAAVASAAFRRLAPSLPRMDEIALDSRILGYTLGCAVVVTLLCGIVPAIRSTRSRFVGMLAGAGRTQVSTRHSLQWVLVAVQVALSVTLLAGAGLLLRSFHELSRADGGFDSSRMLTFRMSGSWTETGNLGQMLQRMERVMAGLRTLPGVESVAATVIPAGVPTAFEQEVQLVERRADSDRPMVVENRAVTSSYFETMRIPLVSGELCHHQPFDAAWGEVMVNRSFANRYFPGSSPVGLHFAGLRRPNRITGIVGDARERGLDRDPVPTVYFCEIPAQPTRVFLIRTRGEPMAMAQAVRVRIKELEPLRSVFDITPLDERIGDSFLQNWLRTVLLVLFAVTALLLACVGLYGTLSYIVSLRRREVGLRLALGASRSIIVKQFLGKGLRIVGLACICGLVLSVAFTRLLSGMLYGVSPSDPITLLTVVLVVLVVAGLASLLPATRAALVEPMRVLRNE
jgi:predicted permease